MLTGGFLQWKADSLKGAQISAAKEIVRDIDDEITAMPGWYHVAAAEASAPSASLSTLYVEANKLPEVSLKAAAMAGIATALHGR